MKTIITIALMVIGTVAMSQEKKSIETAEVGDIIVLTKKLLVQKLYEDNFDVSYVKKGEYRVHKIEYIERWTTKEERKYTLFVTSLDREESYEINVSEAAYYDMDKIYKK